MKYVIKEHLPGVWLLEPLTKNYALSQKDHFIIYGGKSPQKTYTCLQEILGGLEHDFNYNPVPFTAVKKALARDPSQKPHRIRVLWMHAPS